ncbi:MAG TPA: hypothetical protein PKD55_02475 [Bellilinea sp.]|nr:hypothetical protein [Bellilinea sp.]
MSYLTDGDQIMLPHFLNGRMDIAAGWYLRGFRPLPWQYAYTYAVQPDVTVLAGIASGKTRINAGSKILKCISIPYYKALNTSVTAKQAELPFDMFEEWYDGNPNLEHHVEDIKRRPWPIVTFKNGSVYEFRTAGQDAKFIRGTEYDEIDFDECGLDLQGEIVKVLRGRLRGRTVVGRERIARLNATSSPTDALWFFERWQKGFKGSDVWDPHQYLSFRVRTRDNTYLTEPQIASMESEYSDEMKAVEMDAEWPDYGLSMFAKSHIAACTDQSMNDAITMALFPEDSKAIPKPGWRLEEHPRHGITLYEEPNDPDEWYVIAGDPGLDDPPKRNAAAIGVMNSKGRLVYFDWVHGRGSYMPFVNSYKYALEKYRPEIKFIDTTGTQKMMQELAFEQYGIQTDNFNFGQMKDGALNYLIDSITRHEMRWPVIKGLLKQLSIYNRKEDKDIAQDIVMMLSMLAYGLRYRPSTIEVPTNVPPSSMIHVPQIVRRSRMHRTNVSRRR